MKKLTMFIVLTAMATLALSGTAWAVSGAGAIALEFPPAVVTTPWARPARLWPRT